MAIIGSASIQIRADDKYFEPDVQRAVKRIKNVAIQLKADVDLTKASKKIRDLRYRITSKDAVLKVDANVAKAEEKLARLLAKFINKDLNFNAVANTRGANTALRELSERYKNNRIPFTAQADTAAARAQLSYAARNRSSTISARVDPATMAALTGLFNTLTGTLPMEKIKGAIVGVASNFESLATMATFATAAVGALSGALLITAANAFSVAQEIGEVVGLVAFMPAGIAALTTVLKVNKLAWENFGTAATDNSKKANEALAKLPPEAQEAAKALRGVKQEIQKPVQKAFWEATGTSLQDMVKNLLPTFVTGLSRVSGAMGGFSKEVFDSVSGLEGFDGVFENIGQGIDNMVAGIKPALEGLMSFVRVGLTYMPEFGTWMAELGNKFGNFARKAEESGDMIRWMETGIQRAQELGSIVADTVGIFNAFADVAQAAGAPGLTEMADGFGRIRDTVEGEPFRSRLQTVLEGARAGTDAFAEGLDNLTNYIGESSSALGIFLKKTGELGGTALDSIRALFDGTGLGAGVFTALDGLDDALKMMEPGFSDLGGAIGDLGEIAGELFRNMAPGLNQLFETIEGVLAGLKDGIIEAMPVFNEFVQAILTLVQGPVIFLAEQIGNILKVFADLPDAIQTVIMSLGLFLLLKGKFANFFEGIGKSLNNEKSSIGQAFTGIRDGANLTRAGVADSFSTLGAAMKNALVTSAEAGSKAFSPIIGRAEDMAERVKGTASGIGSAFRQGMNISSEFDTVRNGFQNLSTNISQTARGMADTLKGVGSDIVKAVIPAGLRNAASNVHNDLAPARQAFANLVPAAAEAGRQAGSALGGGIARASSGLMSAMGGGWGVALGGATIALGLYAQALAESDARVSSFASSLEKTTGAITGATKKMVAETALDGATNDWDNFFRGVIQGSSSVEEALEEGGISLKQHTDRLSDPSGRDAYVKGLDTISDALRDGIPITDEMAAAIGTTKEELKGVNGNAMRHLADKAQNAAEELAKAEREVQDLAKATGTSTVEAAALAANMDTLKDASSSASEKFSALKGNLDILNGRFRTTRDAARDQAETMLGLGDNLVEIAGKYSGLVEGSTKVNRAFQDSILNKETGLFSNATQGAIDFSREMDGVADSILKAGSSEFDSVLKKTGDLSQAQAASLKVMNDGTGQLRQSLLNAGYDADIVNGIIANLKLNPEDLQGALKVETGEAEAALARVKLSAAALASGNYEVALTALSEDAKNEILKTTEYAEAYKNGGWKAVIGLINEAGPGIEEFILKIQEAKGDKSKINAILDAEFKGRGVIKEATDAVQKYDGMQILEKTAGITDNASIPIGAIKAMVEDYNVTPTMDKYLRGHDLTTPAAVAAKAGIDTFSLTPDPNKSLNATNNTATPVAEAQGTMGTLTDVWRGLFAKNATQGERDAAQTTLNGLVDVTRSLFGNNLAWIARDAAQGDINRLTGKSVDLDANSNPALNKIRDVDNRSIGDKSFNIIGVLSGVSAVVREALGMANGGIMKGGVQKFANGGILKKAQAPAIKAFAGGGIENHTAQIARGAWPVRVWAEPETGGEAYIPLSKNKRKRSLEILRQVMDEFGLAHLAQFADGGIMKTMQSSPVRGTTFKGYQSNTGAVVTTTARAAAAPNIITNVYPSQGLNEEQVADSVSENIYWKLSTQI